MVGGITDVALAACNDTNVSDYPPGIHTWVMPMLQPSAAAEIAYSVGSALKAHYRVLKAEGRALRPEELRKLVTEARGEHNAQTHDAISGHFRIIYRHLTMPGHQRARPTAVQYSGEQEYLDFRDHACRCASRSRYRMCQSPQANDAEWIICASVQPGAEPKDNENNRRLARAAGSYAPRSLII